MPVRCMIHSSDVSRRCASSSFVTMRSGRYAPQPTTWDRSSISEGRRLGRWRGRLDGIETSKLVADLIDEAVDLHIDGNADRIGEAESVGAAMAFHDNAVETEHHRAIIAARVDAQAHLLQGICGEQIADPRENGVLEGGAHELTEHAGRP